MKAPLTARTNEALFFDTGKYDATTSWQTITFKYVIGDIY